MTQPLMIGCCCGTPPPPPNYCCSCNGILPTSGCTQALVTSHIRLVEPGYGLVFDFDLPLLTLDRGLNCSGSSIDNCWGMQTTAIILQNECHRVTFRDASIYCWYPTILGGIARARWILTLRMNIEFNIQHPPSQACGSPGNTGPNGTGPSFTSQVFPIQTCDLVECPESGNWIGPYFPRPTANPAGGIELMEWTGWNGSTAFVEFV